MIGAGFALLAGLRILVVEDEYFIADDLRRALDRVGVNVVGPVADLVSGLDLARREPLDAAIIDVNLGGEMSYALADLLRERGVPFLFSTGYDDATLAATYRGIPRVEKPCDADAVIASLLELTGEGRSAPS